LSCEDGAPRSPQTSGSACKSTQCNNLHDYNLNNFLRESLLYVRSFFLFMFSTLIFLQ
jgi:hypothetical protein